MLTEVLEKRSRNIVGDLLIHREIDKNEDILITLEENHDVDERQLSLVPEEGFDRVTKDDGSKVFVCKSCGKEYKGENTVKSHIGKFHGGIKRGPTSDNSGISKKKAKEEENESSLNTTQDLVAARIREGKAIYNPLDESIQEVIEDDIEDDMEDEENDALHSTALDESIDEMYPPNQQQLVDRRKERMISCSLRQKLHLRKLS